MMVACPRCKELCKVQPAEEPPYFGTLKCPWCKTEKVVDMEVPLDRDSKFLEDMDA